LLTKEDAKHHPKAKNQFLPNIPKPQTFEVEDSRTKESISTKLSFYEQRGFESKMKTKTETLENIKSLKDEIVGV
jgi:hypothetical protein